MSERNYYVVCEDNCRFEGMTKEQIIAAIAEATGTTPTQIDDAFITKIKEMNANKAIKFWFGTTAEFNALATKQGDTLYILTDDDTVESLEQDIANIYTSSNLTNTLLDKIYPIGSIYMSVVDTSPATFLGGVWERWGTGRVPVGVDTTQTEFNAVEKTGGEKTHTLTVDELAKHHHGITTTDDTTGEVSGFVKAAKNGVTNYLITQDSSTGDNPHNNLQPYITCYMWKRTSGICSLSRTETNATVTVTRGSQVISDGASALQYGDIITISAAGSTGYSVTTLTVNGQAFTSGSQYTVTGNVAIVATGTASTYSLARTETNATVTVTRNGEAITDGANVLTYGDEIKITATPATGYNATNIVVNGTMTISSGTIIIVNGNVSIVATGTNATYSLHRTATHCTVEVKRNGTVVADGANVFESGDGVTVTATPETGYTLTTLTVNGISINNGSTMPTYTNVNIIATATAQE